MDEAETQNRNSELEEQVEQLQHENETLRHRLDGHREAIARWRRRAGVDAPVPELELEKTELNRRFSNSDWIYKEYYILPVEHAPELITEAYAWLADRGLTETCERLYLDIKKGWIAILSRDWIE